MLDGTAALLGVDHDRLAELALSARPGAGGLVLVPYLEGERTPNRPDATGALHGVTLGTATPAHLARAAVEGCCAGWPTRSTPWRSSACRCDRVFLVGGGARSAAVRRSPRRCSAGRCWCRPGEYVADGAARQAAWVLTGAEPPVWEPAGTVVREADPTPAVRARYAEVRDLTAARV